MNRLTSYALNLLYQRNPYMLNFHHSRDAFAEFIKQHQDKVYNVVLGMLQNEQDAEEITQDVFIEVYKKASSFKGESAISTWLYRIAVNKSIDHLRSKKTKKRFGIFTALFHPQTNEVVTEPGNFVHPGVLSENKEKAKYLFAAIHSLPETQQTAFILNEMEQLSYKEISEVMQTTVSAVESLLVRAKQNLRKRLGDFYKENI
jgi:RNA polymerase sigma factor (sigma-70 family)